MTTFNTIDRNRQERADRDREEKRERDTQLQIDAEADRQEEERRAELALRVEAASNDAQRKVLDTWARKAAQEHQSAQEALEGLLASPKFDYSKLIDAYETWAAGALRTTPPTPGVIYQGPEAYRRVVPPAPELPTLESMIQNAVMKRAKERASGFHGEVSHAMGRAALDASNEARANEQ